MTRGDWGDAELARGLAALPVHDLDASVGELIRARCHARLAQRGRRVARARAVVEGVSTGVLEPLAVTLLAISFLIGALQRVLLLLS